MLAGVLYWQPNRGFNASLMLSGTILDATSPGPGHHSDVRTRWSSSRT